MRREQVVGESVERRDRGCDEQEATCPERGDPPALWTAAASSDGVRNGERDDG
jgi:hypothetical protein